MNTYDFVHLALLASDGGIQGKTKLQKTVYFLGILTGHDEKLGYRAHFYGPYSSDVADAVGKLSALGFVDKNTVTWGVDVCGFEITGTDYRLNEDGKAIAQTKAAGAPELWEKMKDGLRLLKEAGNLDYVQLSIAAKTYFMLGKVAESVTPERLAEIARSFDWNVTVEQIEEARQFLERVRLVPSANAGPA